MAAAARAGSVPEVARETDGPLATARLERPETREGTDVTERRYDTIRVERDGAVATLTMDRPERMNALTNPLVP